MKIFKYLILGAFLVATPLALTACERDTPLENAAEDLEDGADEIADSIKDATN